MWQMAAGAALGALSSMGGKRVSPNKAANLNVWQAKANMENQYWLNRRAVQEHYKDAVFGAKQAGLHPLYALSGQAPQVSGGLGNIQPQDGTSDLQTMGQALAGGLSA